MSEKDLRFFSRTLVIVLVSISIMFLLLEKLVIHEVFLHHLAAIPLEIVLGVVIVENLLKKKERDVRKKQLRYIKSHIFRSELRRLFIMNFEALKKPSISLEDIKNASLTQLLQMRSEAANIEYKSLKGLEPIILEYVKTQHVWQLFMEKAMDFHFENIVEDMIFLIHFINDIMIFKDTHPQKLFVEGMKGNEVMMRKIYKVLGDGIRSFLNYAIELKEKSPEFLEEILHDYLYTQNMQKESQY